MGMPKIKTEPSKGSRADRLRTLARRVEQTRASSQAIDEAIAMEFGWKYDRDARKWLSGDSKLPDRIQAPFFTLTFDHAKQLLPAGSSWSGGSCDTNSEVVVQPALSDSMRGQRFKVELDIASDLGFVLAFTAACLHAHAAIEDARG